MNSRNTEILSTYEITKEMALNGISANDLSQEEIDEYLEIIFALNHGKRVYYCDTNEGDCILYSEE